MMPSSPCCLAASNSASPSSNASESWTVVLRRSSSASSRARRSRERQVDERLALDLEHVEDLVDDRRAGLSLLHRREARAAVLVERADLAVEHAVGGLHRLRQLLRDLGKRSVRSLPFRLTRRASPAVDVRERAVAVPLDLEQPAVALRDVLLERGEHRLVLAARPAAAPSSSRFRISSQFFGSPSSFAGTSVQRPSAACRAGGR